MLIHPLHALGTPNVSPYRMSRKKTLCVAILRNKVDVGMSQNSGPFVRSNLLGRPLGRSPVRRCRQGSGRKAPEFS